jgi:uncharacterized protein with HEPN domain
VPSSHDPSASLADIIDNIERIQNYVAGLDREAFGADLLRRDADRAPPGTHLRGGFSVG